MALSSYLAFCYISRTVGGRQSAGLLIYTAGSRHLPAAELALLALTEVVLGPIWVWLGIGETPSLATLSGGAVVLAAIAGNALSGLRRWRPPIGAV